jgi:hypothetical protein
METVAQNTLFRQSPWQGELLRNCRSHFVKRRIEATNLHQVRMEFRKSRDGFKMIRLVQRRERN